MALDQSALLEVLEALKAAEVDDRIRKAAETIYQALIEAELSSVIGALPHQRTEARAGWRNGHRPRTITTTAGDLERPATRGLLGHLGPGRPRGGGRLVRQPRRLPESLAAGDVDAFMTSLRTHRDRAMVLAMLLGGLRSAEVRGLKLGDVDMGRRRLRVLGKGGRERQVPVDQVFFAELAAYLRLERPPGLATRVCFVILRGPTAGGPVTEARLRSLFRRHRAMSGAVRVRPHRLRHTYGTELAAAGMDLLALRELMGHSSPETTAAYVHLPIEQLAAEYGAARATLARSAR
jgi:integrase/recombinase XerC